MPLSPEELARRRAVNQAAHRRARLAAARTPMERAVAAWDLWRAAVKALPRKQADAYASALASTLTAQVEQITREGR